LAGLRAGARLTVFFAAAFFLAGAFLAAGLRAGAFFVAFLAAGLEALPEADKAFIEKQLLRATVDESWRGTREYFLARDPGQVERAERDPKHRMALVFRSYLGLSSRWANAGEPSRTMDYQVWCGPAMGAFNEWARGTFLEKPENRRVVVVAETLIQGAATQLRQFLKA